MFGTGSKIKQLLRLVNLVYPWTNYIYSMGPLHVLPPNIIDMRREPCDRCGDAVEWVLTVKNLSLCTPCKDFFTKEIIGE